MTRRDFLATVVAGGLVSPSGLSAGDSGAEALDDAREPGADPASVFEEEVFVAGVFEQRT